MQKCFRVVYVPQNYGFHCDLSPCSKGYSEKETLENIIFLANIAEESVTCMRYQITVCY